VGFELNRRDGDAMGMGKRAESRQQEFWVATESLAGAPRHVFYDRLNGLLAEAGFDRFVESLCEAYYNEGGRPSIPPGVYFRMLLIGYFEDISSQRGIAWRCSDSLSLRKFLSIPLTEETPDHSSLTRINRRLPATVNEQVFEFVLKIAAAKKLLKGNTVGVDSTTLEANAAMRAIVRRDNGDDWKSYLKKLAEAEGVIIENEEDLRRFDQQRRKEGRKKVSNDDWQSPVDPDARIGQMKDGRTHLNYKAEHVVDLESEIIIQADVHHGNTGDTQSVIGNLVEAQVKLDHVFDDIVPQEASHGVIQEMAADKGYHSNDVLKCCHDLGVRTYVPEREGGERRWADKADGLQEAFHSNRQRMQRSKGHNLQKRRSEVVERGFAHLCETGGSRRTWLRGLEKVRNRHLIAVAAHNLGVVMRHLFGFGKPRAFSAAFGLLRLAHLAILTCCRRLTQNWQPVRPQNATFEAKSQTRYMTQFSFIRLPCSTGC
jgi:transposase